MTTPLHLLQRQNLMPMIPRMRQIHLRIAASQSQPCPPFHLDAA